MSVFVRVLITGMTTKEAKRFYLGEGVNLPDWMEISAIDVYFNDNGEVLFLDLTVGNSNRLKEVKPEFVRMVPNTATVEVWFYTR